MMKQCHTLLRHGNPEDSPQLLVQSSDKWCGQDNICYPSMLHWASTPLPLHQGSVPASEGHQCPCILQLPSYTQTWLLLGHKEWGEYRLPHDSQPAPVCVFGLSRRHLCVGEVTGVIAPNYWRQLPNQSMASDWQLPYVTKNSSGVRRMEGTTGPGNHQCPRALWNVTCKCDSSQCCTLACKCVQPGQICLPACGCAANGCLSIFSVADSYGMTVRL